jgi:hypothetical protein
VVDEVVPGQHLVFEGGQGCLGGALFRVVELRPIALVDTEPLGAAAVTVAVRAASTD